MVSDLDGADHLLAAGLALMSVGLLFRKAPALGEVSRRDFYLSAAASSMALAAVVLVLWRFAGRPLERFGLLEGVGDPGETGAAAGVWAVLLVGAVVAIRAGAARAWLERVYSRYDNLMPATRRELAASWLTSAAAGSGEEIVYRGFLLWYCAALGGVPAALAATSLLFGVAHGYQSRFGVIFATVAGAALGAAYLASGSLLLVMWMHSTYNMASFATGRIVLVERRFGAGLSAEVKAAERMS